MSSETHVGGNVDAGNDFIGRDQHTRNQSGGAQVYLALTDRERADWVIAQISAISTHLAQVNEKLATLEQIDEALIGSRLRGERGLVADVQRLWTVVIGIVIVLALIGVIEIAQWVILWRMLN